MIRKTLITYFLLIFLISVSHPTTALQASPLPPISASSAILIDAASRKVLWQKNAQEKRPVASTTKIMTAILALEKGRLDSKVTTSQRAADIGESELYLSVGEQRTVEELLYGTLLRSANDAAIALAEYTGGSVENFVNMMNEKARQIGALETRFTNPHGLTDGNNFSTAYDLALIASYAMRNKKFAQIVATQEYTISWPNNAYPRVAINHNKLLQRYPLANGIKTGWTREAGYCIVASAKKGNFQLVAVILNAPDSKSRFRDAQALLEYGLTNFKRQRLIRKGKVYGKLSFPTTDETTNAIAQTELVAIIKQAPANSVKQSVTLNQSLTLPLAQGQKVGEVKVSQFGQELGQVNLVAQKTIPKPTFFYKLFRLIRRIIKERGEK